MRVVSPLGSAVVRCQKMADKKQWWEKPGFGIQYQIEARPGWRWNRNYDKFNALMMDEHGHLKFNGPLCKMKEWVEFSKQVGVDYHIFEVKWHDGICYFDTKYTDWKTPEDYVQIYADESRKAKIPFLFYYSSIFDHNPQFDAIQPLRTCTPSFFTLRTTPILRKTLIQGFSFVFAVIAGLDFKRNRLIRNYQKDKSAKWLDHFWFPPFKNEPKTYEIYMFRQLIELITRYKPDGLWMDWYMFSLDESAHKIMDFMEKYYPEVILTFNTSINSKLKWAHYTTAEAHDVKTAWQKGNRYRRKKNPWELIGPAANAWDNFLPRPDVHEAARMAAILMASGGKACFGMPSRMDGALYPGPAEQLAKFGQWYKPRKRLFQEATPMDYKGKKVPGISVKEKHLKTIGDIQENDPLIHLIYLFGGPKQDLTVKFCRKHWETLETIILEPQHQELEYQKDAQEFSLTIPKKEVDYIDTMLRIIMTRK